jgi:hypothetical protein
VLRIAGDTVVEAFAGFMWLTPSGYTELQVILAAIRAFVLWIHARRFE